MKPKKLPAKQTKENIEELNTLLFESGKVNTNWTTVYDDYPLDKITENVIKSLAKYGNGVLLADIIEAEGYDATDDVDSLGIRLMTDIYAQWIDTAVFIKRDDNLLNAPVMETPRWKPLFDHELAKLVVERGTLMAHRTTFYNWEENFLHNKTMPPVVALFNLHKKEWEEFAGDNLDTRHTGYQAHVLHEDGTFRNVRYEVEMDEVMELLSER